MDCGVDIEITKAQSGMSLNRDVVDRRGNVLLRSGQSLTERHLALIRAHGIKHIDIASGTAAAAAPKGREATPADRLFRNLDPNNPLVQELLRVHQIRYARAQEDTT
jgi:molybdopterin biosynthesis enzyme